jgi:hypothetical protein
MHLVIRGDAALPYLNKKIESKTFRDLLSIFCFVCVLSKKFHVNLSEKLKAKNYGSCYYKNKKQVGYKVLN